MKYELREVERMLSVDLKPRHFMERKDGKKLTELVTAMRIETNRVCEVMRDALFENIDDTIKRSYVRLHQLDLVRLLNGAGCYLQVDHQESMYTHGMRTVENEYKEIRRILMRLYMFQYKNCRPYFDEEIPLPDYLRECNVWVVKKMKEKAYTRMLRLLVKTELREIVLLPFVHFISAKEMTLYDVRFLLHYRKELAAYFVLRISTDVPLTKFLVEQEMNDVSMKEFYIEKLRRIAAGLPSPKRKLELFQYHLKLLNQLEQRSMQRFDASLPTVREQLATWLIAEIYFVAAKLPRPVTNETFVSQQNGSPGQKLKLNLSGAAMGCWFKLLVAESILPRDNIMAVFRGASKVLSSKKKDEDLSVNSLKNNYHTIEEGTKRVVKDQLIGMLNLLNSR